MARGTECFKKSWVNDMLVLNRKPGESILIGDDVEIRILEVADGGIKIGIEAPRDRTILRKEIYEQVVQENRKAMEGDNRQLLILKKTDLGRK